MDQALKTKWVEALRSGEFKQGQCFLQQEDRFCCLGVLLKIQGADIDKLYAGQSRITTKLPPSFSAGLTNDERNELANRNDGAAEHCPKTYSFPEIADYIEKNL